MHASLKDYCLSVKKHVLVSDVFAVFFLASFFLLYFAFLPVKVAGYVTAPFVMEVFFIVSYDIICFALSL